MFSTEEWLMPGAEAGRRVSALDGTVKLLFRFPDGALAESVVLFSKGRASACLSSQSGCACGCAFCATGARGFTRDLTAGEILAQFASCREAAGGKLGGLVFMGMGEPLLNWENVKRAALEISDQKKAALPASRMTVSTVGIAPAIRELADSGPGVNLAVSLVTAGKGRAALVPMDARYPLSEVLGAARYYCGRTGRGVLLEYILFAGLNDSPEDARALAGLAGGLDCRVNLIRYNPAGNRAFSAPPPEKAAAFQRVLMDAGVRTYLRREHGADIGAACGQLAGLYEDGR